MLQLEEDNPGGFGAVLTQQWADGFEHVIAYASRAYLLQLAAVAWATDNFSVYLLGHKFTLHIDHKPLETYPRCTKRH